MTWRRPAKTPRRAPSPPSCPSSAIAMRRRTRLRPPLSVPWTRAHTSLRSAALPHVVEWPRTRVLAGWDQVVFSVSCQCLEHPLPRGIAHPYEHCPFFFPPLPLPLLTLFSSVLIAVAAYLVGGCAYQRTVMHQRGWRQCPNFSLWAGMFDFIKVCLLALVPCRSRRGSCIGGTASHKYRESSASRLPTSRMD